MFNTVRARLSAPDPMPTHFDLQPAIAACRAAATASQVLLVQRPKPMSEARLEGRESRPIVSYKPNPHTPSPARRCRALSSPASTASPAARLQGLDRPAIA